MRSAILLPMLHIELMIFFLVGYLAIVFEKFLHVNKSAVALVMAVLCWLLFLGDSHALLSSTLMAEQIYDVAQIIFFLLAVMIIVELVDSHHGFKMVTDLIYSSSKRKMLWFLIVISFFMSAVLDNLTTMIVIASLLRKMVPNAKDRWLMGSIVLITVNAGGAWTPIGDVTTTMLWIHDRITTWETVRSLFVPSVVNALVAGLIGTWLIKGENKKIEGQLIIQKMEPGAKRVFCLGLLSLLLIPFWKAVLHVPPFMGALMGLGLLWLATDIMHFSYGEERWHLRVTHVMTKIDMSGILFFLGILLAINALQSAGLLTEFASLLEKLIPSSNSIAVVIGLISAVIDNVPLVAASMGMYDLQQFAQNSSFWQLLAYAAGTGGSVLIIGSAAGVVFMGIEKVDFLWYMKKISWIALIGYFAGIAVYLLMYPLLYT
ncbi:MAG: Na(+)/H(+) antiporter NhaD [Chlamydiales bacterium]|nr:Na(+)/H(+) antiporter NhaD [Chlamydiales bacterium]MCH9620375.1 Na(+)/H(+) antiporter NhaD [Chlamydiales bacterium]MCH9622979.1 Na(+)/H(+) antiporter NhaD [Chlamydiales bacterium]